MGSHHHHHRGASAAFRWSVLLNALLTGAKLAIGFGFGSLALIGDAIHNLGDVVGLLLAWGAERLSLRPARGRFTYGYRTKHPPGSFDQRHVGLCCGAPGGGRGLDRLQRPEPLVAGPVAVAASAGIAINLLSARLFGG